MLGARMEDEQQGRRCVAIAEELCAKGRYEEAIAWYQQAIAHAPGALGGYGLVVGELLFDLQRYADAARAFEAMVQSMPGHAQGWEALGRTLAMLGAPERAIVALERAIALAPGWGEALYHAALAYADLGRRTECDDRLRRAIAIDPRFAAAARDDGLL